MVIFGASGDLTRRKLVPALYSLARERLLPSGFAICGFARRPLPFADDMKTAVGQFARRRPVDESLWESFGSAISYVSGDFDDPDVAEWPCHLVRSPSRLAVGLVPVPYGMPRLAGRGSVGRWFSRWRPRRAGRRGGPACSRSRSGARQCRGRGL
ncbi:MAG TPA: hypothetical protein PKI49_13450, partial [Pseudomonadota bacterium]|nr:hypothetical protein [Pseudomonadota bacterium]